MKQLKLIPEKKYAKRKVARAISLRGANHVVLKARKPLLRREHAGVRTILRDTQDRFGVRLRALAVMPDHIHLILNVSSRTQFANSLRYLAGQLALTVAKGKLWRARAWSRPITTARDLTIATRYVARNPIKSRLWDERDTFFILGGILQL